MSGILLRQALIDSFEDALAVPVVVPGSSAHVLVETIVAHSSVLTEAQRASYAESTPAVLVGVRGTSETVFLDDGTSSGRLDGRFVLSATVLAKDLDATEDAPAIHREDVALAIAEKLAVVVRYDRPSVSTSDVTRLRIEPGFTEPSDTLGLGAFILTWEQGVELDPIDVSSLDDLATVTTTYDVAPGGGAPEMEGEVTDLEETP